MKNFLQKVKDKVVDLFRKLTGTVKSLIPVGIKIVEAVKRITDSKIADVIVELTVNTDLDNKALKAIRELLPKVLQELDEWDDAIEGSDEEKLKNSLIKINSYSKPKKNLLYLGIAANINKKLSGLTYEQSITATHEAYNDPELLNV